MRTIVVAVDFTDHSNNAARYAADMADAIGGELHLVHVMLLPDVPREVPIPDYALDEIRDDSLTSLNKLAEELTARTSGRISVATDLETGSPEDRITVFCRWKKPFIFVHAASESYQPSIRQLPYPLLTIPPYARYHSINTVVLACDQEDINDGIPVPVDYLRELRDCFKARFEILHIATQEESAATTTFDHWRESLDQHFPEVHIVISLAVEDGTHEYLTHHRVDWLVVFPKKGGLFHLHKNLSDNIVLHCPVPTISIHE